MVVSANLQPWARVDIVIKGLDDATQTKTLQFTNRPCAQGDATYLPLLKSYSGLSLEVGQDGLPTSGSGSIVINDQWESLGENRRVFDYFDRYTPINQTVTVYRGINTLGDLTLPSWTLLYTGKVESYSKDKETLTFSVSNNLLESKITTAKITTDLAASGYSVPDQSIGKDLPIVISNTDITVPAYSLDWSASTAGSCRYAYATRIGSSFVANPTPTAIYAKDMDNVYRSLFPAGTAFGVIGNASIGSNYPSNPGLSESIIPFALSSVGSGGVIVTGVSWWCKGQPAHAVDATGQITFKVYRSLSTSIDTVNMAAWEEVYSKDISKSGYTTQLYAGADFFVDCPFDSAIVLGGAGIDSIQDYSIFAIGIKLSNYTGSTATDFTHGGVFALGGTYFYRTTFGGDTTLGTGYVPILKVNCATFSTASSPALNEKGLGFSYVNISPTLTTSRVSELDIAVTLPNGLTDDGSGSITGVAGQALTYPHHIAKALGWTYNGTSWADGSIIDTTTFSSLYTIFSAGSYQRKITGFTSGSTSLQDLLYTIAKEMSCAIVPLSNGKLALWPWGNTGSVVRTFDDSSILEYGATEETDPSTVINNISVEYGRSFTEIFDQYQASGKAENLQGVVVINKGTSGYYSSLLSNSETLYGKRELEESGSQWIGDVTSATTRALYYILRHEHTHRTFNITVSYFDNTDLKLMDIIDVLSVHGPAFQGTTSKARLPTVGGVDCDPLKGNYFKQAQRRRVQIIGLNNDYDGDYPKLVIKCREIKPRHKNDPTAENL